MPTRNLDRGTRRTTGVAVVALVLGLATTALAPAVWADTLNRKDPAGDAVKVVDARRMKADNGIDAVTVSVKVPGFKRSRVENVTFPMLGVAGGVAKPYTVFTFRKGGSLRVQLYPEPFPVGYGPGETRPDRLRCPGLQASWQNGVGASVRVPQDCLQGDSEELRLGVWVNRTNARKARHSDWVPGRYATLSKPLPRQTPTPE